MKITRDRGGFFIFKYQEYRFEYPPTRGAPENNPMYKGYFLLSYSEFEPKVTIQISSHTHYLTVNYQYVTRVKINLPTSQYQKVSNLQ